MVLVPGLDLDYTNLVDARIEVAVIQDNYGQCNIMSKSVDNEKWQQKYFELQ